MASIETRSTKSGPRYDVRYRTRSGQRRRTFDRLGDARTFAAGVELDRVPRTTRQRSMITYQQWWDLWQDTVVDLRRSSAARDQSYGRNHILPRFAATPLGGIEHLAVRQWVADLVRAGLAPATVVKTFQVLAKSLRAAEAAGWLASCPTDGVLLPRIEDAPFRCLEPQEIHRLASSIDPRYEALVLLGCYGGLRRGELAGLRRLDVDVSMQRVTINQSMTEVSGHLEVGPPKTPSGKRSVPIPSFVAAALSGHLGSHTNAYVFPAPGGGPLRGTHFAQRFWRPATIAAGLSGTRIHDMRHTAISLWISAGMTPIEVAQIAGHRSTSVVLDRYGHLMPRPDGCPITRMAAPHAQRDRSEAARMPYSARERSARLGV